VTPKVWTKNFWGFFMRKKHDYVALLKYMRMLKDGYSVKSISKNYGIGADRLSYLWHLYQEQGTTVLHRKKNIRADGALKQHILSDIEKNHLTLVQASLKIATLLYIPILNGIYCITRKTSSILYCLHSYLLISIAKIWNIFNISKFITIFLWKSLIIFHFSLTLH
jgi:hypothetical protein